MHQPPLTFFHQVAFYRCVLRLMGEVTMSSVIKVPPPLEGEVLHDRYLIFLSFRNTSNFYIMWFDRWIVPEISKFWFGLFYFARFSFSIAISKGPFLFIAYFQRQVSEFFPCCLFCFYKHLKKKPLIWFINRKVIKISHT